MEIALIVITLAVDQLSKYWIQHASLTGSITVIPNFFYITYLRNEGAAWSMLSGRRAFLCLIAVVAIGVMLWYLIKAKEKKEKLTCAALSLMIAGAAGNLIDRLVLGYVRDFLHFYPFGYDFPVFNIADTALTIGVILLILGILKGEDEKEKA